MFVQTHLAKVTDYALKSNIIGKNRRSIYSYQKIAYNVMGLALSLIVYINFYLNKTGYNFLKQT